MSGRCGAGLLLEDTRYRQRVLHPRVQHERHQGREPGLQALGQFRLDEPGRVSQAVQGQLLLAFDLLGVFDQFKPKFTKRYAQISDVAVDALKRYAEEVRSGKFPDAEHSYGMKPEEEQQLARLVASRKR